VRRDFQGGWSGDEVDFFKNKNLTLDQQEAMKFMKKILNWRKSKPVIHRGKLVHFIPQDNIYVYFRTLGTEKVMVVMNGNASEKLVNTERFAEELKGKTKAKNILTDETLQSLDTIKVPAKTALILELE